MHPWIQDRKTDLLLWITFLVGIFLRFLPGLQAGFPLNDGGMFLSMIRDLRANHFLIPAFTSYNVSNIPFAYPPFGIYIATLLSSVFPVSEVDLLLWLPPLLATAILLAFYWLSLKVFDSRPKALIATAFFTFLPGSADWFIMGGGLTRSFGILFSLFALGYVYQVFHDGNRKQLFLSVLFCALTVLSHPEVGLQTAGLCFLFWLFYGRNIAGMKNALLVALGTALLAAPWWLTVLYQHGLAPFESAMQTGVRETLWASLFHSIFSTQGGLPILPVFSLAGMVICLRERKWLLPIWTLLPFFVDPRNAPAIAIFPLILLAVKGMYFLKEEFEKAYSRTTQKNDTIPARITTGILVVLLLYLLVVAYLSTGNLVRVSLSESDRATMEWVKANVPVDSHFLLITNKGQISPMTDSYQEWFPALTEHRSENTLQGKEWTLGPRFYSYTQALVALQTCSNVECLQEWTLHNNVEFDYLLIQKQRASSELITSLKSDEQYLVVYESGDVVIFSSE